MAKCKICKTNIPDGNEYCNNCQDKGNSNSNESYLDSLLNSVKNTTPATDSIYKKKSDSTINNKKTNDKQISNSRLGKSELISSNEEDDFQDYSSYDIDLNDIKDFDQFSISDDLKDLHSNIVIGDEELFGEDLSELLSEEEPINLKVPSNEAYEENNGSYEENNSLYDENKGLYEENNGSYKENNGSYEKNKGLYEENNRSYENNGSYEENNRSYENNGSYEEKNGSYDENNGSYDENNGAYKKDNVKADEQNESDHLMPTQQDTELHTNDVRLSESAMDDNIQEHPYTNLQGENNDEQNSEQIYTPDINQEVNQSEDLPAEKEDNFNTEELAGYELKSDYDTDFNDLLNSLDTYQGEEFEESGVQNGKTSLQEDESATADEFEQIDQEEDDFLSLLNQISSEDPVAEDVKAINELLNGTSPEQLKKKSMPSDVGEVFSDALKVVSSLHDDELKEAELLGKIPEAKGVGKKDKKDKSKKVKKSSKKVKPIKSADDKPKKNLFQRLFGNIKDESTPKTESSEKKQEGGAIAPKKSGKKEKPAKGKKGAPVTEEAAASEGSKGKGKGQPDKEGTPETKEDKKGKKKDKKEKKVKTKEIIQVIDEIEEDEGRINRLGAFIVFIFFGLLALLLYVGTNMVSYTLSIQNATNYFENQKYTQAYDEVYGKKIKDADIELYDKIQTVMFVNKQLNSYNNYYSLGKYPEALDSLLKGLKRYDKYIELATMLGISTDLNYVRSQILAELDREFNLSEADAIKINSYKNMTDYSMEVYDVVLENASN